VDSEAKWNKLQLLAVEALKMAPCKIEVKQRVYVIDKGTKTSFPEIYLGVVSRTKFPVANKNPGM